MLKFFLLVALSVGAQGGLLTPIFNAVSVIELISAANKIVLEFQRKISDGLAVEPLGFTEACNTPLITFPGVAVVPGDLTLNAGIVALPLPFLCSQPDGSILQRLTCRIGAADCTYVHNKYSGNCNNSTNPVPDTTQEDGQVFVCNDKNPTGYNFANITDECGILLGKVLGVDLDYKLDLAIATELRARLAADLCPPIPGTYPTKYDNVGCTSDCRNNHQYASGICITNADPTAVFTGEVNSQFQCNCAPLT